MLFYVYPLRFVDNLFAEGVLGLGAKGRVAHHVSQSEVAGLFEIFGFGFATVYLIFACTHFRAYRKRALLQLDLCKAFMTRGAAWRYVALASAGVLSIVLALSIRPPYNGLAGYAYCLIGDVEGVYLAIEGNGQKRELARMAAARDEVESDTEVTRV